MAYDEELAERVREQLAPLAGFVIAGRPLIVDDNDLGRWVTSGVDYARSLPPKKPKPPKPKNPTLS